MKIFIFGFLILISAALTNCTDSRASTDHVSAQVPVNGAQFKDGKGVSLTPLMMSSIGLRTAEVQEEKIVPTFTIALQAMQRGTETSGWLTEAQATRLKSGDEVQLGSSKGSVLRIEKAPSAMFGDFEITVQTNVLREAGTALSATFRLSEGEAVTAVPKGALLTTAEGTFVYAKNDEFYLRTPVQVGAVGNEHVEIIDGLYAGDEIVTTPVMSLWLAELQILRGGKACTCGH